MDTPGSLRTNIRLWCCGGFVREQREIYSLDTTRVSTDTPAIQIFSREEPFSCRSIVEIVAATVWFDFFS